MASRQSWAVPCYVVDVDAASEARAQLDREIELKALQVECAEALAGQWTEGSDRGWLLSILEGTAGTVLAVTRGREAGKWADEAAQLRRELARLQLERRLLEIDPG
jgi:hypothetical protein